MLSDVDIPLAYSFIQDFAAGLVTLAQREEALGQVWHTPNAETVTTRRFVEMVFAQVGRPARLQGLPKIAINPFALFVPPMAAVKETLYQSEHPWVVDDSKFTCAFGVRATPHQ